MQVRQAVFLGYIDILGHSRVLALHSLTKLDLLCSAMSAAAIQASGVPKGRVPRGNVVAFGTGFVVVRSCEVRVWIVWKMQGGWVERMEIGEEAQQMFEQIMALEKILTGKDRNVMEKVFGMCESKRRAL